MSDAPLHETKEVYGVSEDCKYNDHPLCRSPRCGCSCHRQTRMGADSNSVNRTVATEGRTTSIQTGLDKYCPVCKLKAPFDQFYCKVDGSKLSSLRCPECQTPGDAEDNYCGHCGCSMKAGDRELEAAAIGIPIAEVPAQSPEEAEVRMQAAMKEVRLTPDNMAPQPVVKVGNSKISVGMFK